jgi:hypothetical protein
MSRSKHAGLPLIGELRATAEGLDADHVELFAQADARARAFLALNGVLLSGDGDDRFYPLVIDLARQHEPERYAEAEKKLGQASTATANLYAPQLDAAYYLGLAVGMRLVGGAR